MSELKDLGISVKQHSKYSNLLHFSYDQIESPRSHRVVNECRGLILDFADNFNVVAYPFKRFFNYGEESAEKIHWETAYVQEKLDGSLCYVWWYAGEWFVSTRGSPDAGGQVGEWPILFHELFWMSFYCSMADTDFQIGSTRSDTVIRQGKMYTRRMNPNFTYIFELTAPENRVVVPHNNHRVTLIGVRNNETTWEQPVSHFKDDFPVVKQYKMGSFDEVLWAALKLDPLESEGYVLVDPLFHRVKIKSPKYVAIHHLKDGFGPRRIVDLIKLGERSEVLAYFPEYVELFDRIEAKIKHLIDVIDLDYDKHHHYNDQKQFALSVANTVLPAAMFAIRKGHAKDAEDYLLHVKNKNGQMGMASEKILELIKEKTKEDAT